MKRDSYYLERFMIPCRFLASLATADLRSQSAKRQYIYISSGPSSSPQLCRIPSIQSIGSPAAMSQASSSESRIPQPWNRNSVEPQSTCLIYNESHAGEKRVLAGSD